MGELIHEGTPPPHRCVAELPALSKHNYGAIFRCSCGVHYKKKDVEHWGYSDEYGEQDWRSPEWVEVKDAAGNEWRTEEVPFEQYLSDLRWGRATCVDHGRVSKKHRHTRRV